MPKKLANLADLRPQVVNANKHTERGAAMLEKSLQTDGPIGAITAAADGEVFDGSLRLEKYADIMPGVKPIFVESDGRPVVVVRTDIPSASDPRAKRLGVAANSIPAMDYNPDGAILALLAREDAQIEQYAKLDDAAVLAIAEAAKEAEGGGGGADDGNYSRKIEPPEYKITGAKPSIDQLFDKSKTDNLIKNIDAAIGIPDEDKAFLRVAAQRHTVLNFKMIAEYYAHASPELQSLMEDSALVIIDFRRAISLGFVELTKGIAALVSEEYGDD